MSAPPRRPTRTAAAIGTARGYGESVQGEARVAWQADWSEEKEESEQSGRKPRRKRARQEEPTAEGAAAAGAPAPAVRRSREERRAELQRWLAANRNQNTAATYASGWRQFVRWVDEVNKTARSPEDRIDSERPEEEDVAGYMQHMVVSKGSPMTSVASAMAAIADHLRPTRTNDYNPCRGYTIDLMRTTLAREATASGQKQELSWPLVKAVVQTTQAAAGDETAARDGCLILLAYFCYLRGSEIARMKRGDVRINVEEVAGERRRVLRVFVDPLCKNDAERKGHTRMVMEKSEKSRLCMVRVMEAYLTATAGADASAPLFPRADGGVMKVDTPRGRLRQWLQRAGQSAAAAAEYGFHSLRSGAATASAKAGVTEEKIKLHGNWKSDAVKAYIRPDTEDRLAASEALGR